MYHGGVMLSKKRKSGIPTGNADEYFVMGELLRRGFDAQLADRNTKGYDLVVGRSDDAALRTVQVKTVRSPPWYVRLADFEKLSDRTTVDVLLGREDGKKAVRYFIARNCDLAKCVHRPPNWKKNGFEVEKVQCADSLQLTYVRARSSHVLCDERSKASLS
jgi:hypothetical protein